MSSRLSALLMCGCAIAAPAWANSVDQATLIPHTLAQAVDIATSNSLAIKVADASTQGASARVRQARSNFGPTVSVKADLLHTNNFDSFSDTQASVSIPSIGLMSTVDITRSVPKYQFTPALRIDYNLYNGGYDSAALSEAHLREKAAETERDIASRAVAHDVASSYLQLRRDCLLHELAAQRLTLSVTKAGYSARQYAGGRVSDIENQASQLALTESELEVRSRSIDVQTSYAAFLADLSRPDEPGGSPEVACRFESTLAGDMEMLAHLAAGDPQMERRGYELEAAYAHVDAERAGFKPKVSLFAQYTGISRSNTDTNFSHVGRRDFIVGIQFTYTLFDRWYTRSRVDESRAEAQRISWRNQQVAEDLAKARRKSEMLVRGAETQLELSSSRLKLSSARRALAAQRLASGTGTSIALDEAKSEEQIALLNVSVAEVDVAINRLGLLFPSPSKRYPDETNPA
ncbi:TolC family protein [Burkholderia sp. FERM BP-3421]|uniref:TolC family protein n=1 Tax=Burkholderia sp. FERM BP-3421 TaxID=1494466 RepID=UPI00236159AF|nr:TolC family protein [Burkholderia sp. FERM BP-3421]WDD92419.1 TolC family protein [Burkholderia sp. FERM BP-3421]